MFYVRFVIGVTKCKQVEGLVADRNLCLGDLIGVIKTFFHKIGITRVQSRVDVSFSRQLVLGRVTSAKSFSQMATYLFSAYTYVPLKHGIVFEGRNRFLCPLNGYGSQIRFKPAYNPYTEPSMEVFGYHPDLKKWTEIGNSGMFRPEMLLPMGLPKVGASCSTRA